MSPRFVPDDSQTVAQRALALFAAVRADLDTLNLSRASIRGRVLVVWHASTGGFADTDWKGAWSLCGGDARAMLAHREDATAVLERAERDGHAVPQSESPAALLRAMPPDAVALLLFFQDKAAVMRFDDGDASLN